MKVVIKGITYPFDSVEKLTLRELLQLEVQSEAEGKRLTMGQLQAMQVSISQCKTNAEREAHPDATWLFAVAVWVARRRAGENVSFGDALEFDPATEMQIVVDPVGGGLAGPQVPRSVSDRGVKRPSDRVKKTSAKASTAE